MCAFLKILTRKYIYRFQREEGRKRIKGREKQTDRQISMRKGNIKWLLLVNDSSKDKKQNLDMCTNRVLIPQHFGVQSDAPTN